MKQLTIKIDGKLGGARLDIALVNANLGMSRRKIRRIIDIGGAYINNHRVRVASRQVQLGDTVRLEYQDELVKKLRQENFIFTDQDILFENKYIVVVNKPPGLPSQATRDQSVVHVVPVLQQYYKSVHCPVPDLILVHRLDKETSGALIVAKNAATATYLTQQFREKLVEKEYLAACFGLPEKEKFDFKCHLSPIQPKTGVVTLVRSGGKFSHTHFEVQAVNVESQLSLVRCFPSTGRSHQLRVHLDLNHLPIVGDKKYGCKVRPKLTSSLSVLTGTHHLLHCKRMKLKWSENAKPIDVLAPLPINFLKFIDSAFANLNQESL